MSCCMVGDAAACEVLDARLHAAVDTCNVYMQLPNIREGRKGIEAAQAFETLWHLVLGQPANDHAVSKCELFQCR